MFRVRSEVVSKNDTISPASVASYDCAAAPARGRNLRIVALALLGTALGAGGMIAAVSLVEAGDDASARSFLQQEAAKRHVARPAPVTSSAYSSTTYSYAPQQRSWSMPLFRSTPEGKIAQPVLNLNPFHPRDAAKAKKPSKKSQAVASKSAPLPIDEAEALNVVSGAADTARTICVRMCDGFHSPIGYLRSASDLAGHEALCKAQNPDIPVQVFKVAAGEATIDNAVARDGKLYGRLPVAYGHERSSDPACRPAIAGANDRRVSLLRDFTLRAGDTVVLNGQVKVFNGGSRWPYAASDFRDFRSSPYLSAAQRKKIDEMVGVSRQDAAIRATRRMARLQEASFQPRNTVFDVTPIVLRGGHSLNDGTPSPVRIVIPSPFSERN
ncbi:MAG: DUF2865 domain-containing protein [Bosea sp. (in: a-proteobacteria)]